jgi:hypothetical protein
MKGKLPYNKKAVFFEREDFANDKELAQAIGSCIEAQKRAAFSRLDEIFKPNAEAGHAVSREALDELLKAGLDVNGIRTNRNLSNVVVFNDPRFQDAVLSDEIKAARERVDRLVEKKLRALFEGQETLDVRSSGFFLYPPKGFMGWHTNSESPGWRFYVNVAEEPGKSFIRYRDPRTGQIVTSWDKKISFRLFRVTRRDPIWHAIYSDTYRYSFGYHVYKKPGFLNRLQKKVSRIFRGP